MNGVRLSLAAAAFLAVHSWAFAYQLPDIPYNTKDAGKVVFSHDKHVSKPSVGKNCKNCHQDGKKKMSATMADMEKGKSCGACHDGKKAFSISRCASCHTVPVIAMKDRSTGPIAFDHRKHAEDSPCGSCHTKLYRTGDNKPVGMAAMKQGKSCGACHNGKTAFTVAKCEKCHPTRDMKYKLAVGDVTFGHDAHTGSYSCSECHPGIFTPGKKNVAVSMEEMAKGKSCGACHDGKTAFTVAGSCYKCHH